MKRLYVHAHCQNSVSQELIWVLSWNFQRILKGEDHLTKRQYILTTADTTVTATFTIIITHTTTICTAKNIELKLSRSIWTYRLSKAYFSNLITMANCIKLKFPELMRGIFY